ncbi:probable serine/threonine-protein kinase PBL28 [Rutidosis leptorrhynchoides]|uniref:probable serine/threonine-protein kinase PBL28 n=1 Tax=Rutidosis leptorrhynchoides TaxID=125765 RepID=UPI003A99061E
MDAFMKKFKNLKIRWEEITSATNNFDHNNFVGGGGFGRVYMGALARFNDRNMVAFKCLDRKHGQGDAEFLKEITFLSRYKHANIICLLGYCIQGKEMILVYEYASRGSLDRHLASTGLNWTQRLKICVAAAKGLNYLHDPRDTSQRLIHCDIKSANILLDDKWNAKVADFGLSKIAPVNQENSMLLTNALGTLGYCDPLFLETYSLTKESDIYSFGVVLFEVLCGKLCSQKSNDGQFRYLVLMWKKRYEENKLDEIIFTDLKHNMCPTSLKIFSDIAFQCLKRSRIERPTIYLVLLYLEKALKYQENFEFPLRFKEVKGYEDILNFATPPLTYSSLEELKACLEGFFVNGGTTWITMKDIDDENPIKLVSSKECVYDEYNFINYNDRYSDEYNSRFKSGTYNTHGGTFSVVISTQFLSTYITYTVNLVFKCPQILKENLKQQYISIIYEMNGGGKQISIVHIGEKREDEWLVARLDDFTIYDQSCTVDFERHEYSLQIEGIELKPLPMASI